MSNIGAEPLGLNYPFKSPLFVFELANNHMGDLDHGLRVIDEISRVAKDFDFSFAFKLQYRQLDTFIHKSFQGQRDNKIINRFEDTALDTRRRKLLVSAIKQHGFLTMCTPFDEASVTHIIDDGIDILKVASCSLTDWPLLERLARENPPIIGSTAGVSSEDIDRVVTFFANRKKSLALMACVAQYPTPVASLELNRIDMLRSRYPKLRIGYSTHEDPDETMPVAMAIAKGAEIFEKHVGLATDRYSLNAYSASPAQIHSWLDAAKKAFAIAGQTATLASPNEAEQRALLELLRGIYLKRSVKAGDQIADDDVEFAIPARSGQVTANDWSKYSKHIAERDIDIGEPLMRLDTNCVDTREQVRSIVERVKALLADSKSTVPDEAVLELSHHYGIDRFYAFGATMITVVNRSYCKKLIAVLPGQKHPPQFHKAKEETFHVLFGTLVLTLDGAERTCRPGDVVTITPGTVHEFNSQTGCLFEEISSMHIPEDSFYCDASINGNRDRKTILRHWV